MLGTTTIARLAVRNLFRNRWRSVLTAGGIAVAVGMLVWTTGLTDGMSATFIRGSTAVEMGQIQVHTEAYVDRSSIFHSFTAGPELFEQIEAVPDVEGATGRVIAYGLVGHEQRSQVARVVGVYPEREPSVTVLVDGVTDGRWLSSDPPDYPAPREVVVGSGFASQVDVGVGDELVVFAQAANGSLGNDLMEVVGILDTGNSAIDRMSVYLHIDDVQYLAALEGRLHEISVRIDRYENAPQVADAIAAAMGAERSAASEDAGEEPSDDMLVVRAWQEIMPELNTMLELYDSSIGITFAIIFAIVALGILNTQRMSALERRREFGVLMAIGISPRQLGSTIVVETIALTLLGGLIGTAIGVGITYYHATAGFDMSAFSDQASFSMMGVSFSERLYFVIKPRAVIQPIIWTIGVSILCGLWPAIKSARLNVTQAISGRTG